MSTELYLQCVIGGLMGILCHILFIKLPSLKNQAKVANLKFSLRNYFMDDWLALVSSVVTIAVFMFILPEIVNFKPLVLKYLKYAAVFVGFAGSSILQAVLGKTSKMIMNIVDTKTNIADSVTIDPQTTIKETAKP
jgi:hypothetical protein